MMALCVDYWAKVDALIVAGRAWARSGGIAPEHNNLIRAIDALDQPQPRWRSEPQPGAAGAWDWGVMEGNATLCLVTSRGDADKIATALNAADAREGKA